jgi:zinc transporter ZupT
VGLVFALVALAGYLAGAPVVGAVATGFALVAALLNAVFRFCLGCEMYLLFRRLLGSSRERGDRVEILPQRTRVDGAAKTGRENETDNRFENKEKVIT